jgi:uncharacterized membrane protein YeiB
MIRGVLFLAALIAWLTMVTSMIAITVCAIAATRNRLPDAPRHWLVELKKYHAILYPDQFSTNGLKWRAKWVWFSWAFFGSFAALIICVGLLALYAKLGQPPHTPG